MRGEFTTPIARKDHVCNLCPYPIEKGQKYSRWKGRFENEWASNRMHLECSEAYLQNDGGDLIPSDIGGHDLDEYFKQAEIEQPDWMKTRRQQEETE